MESDVRPLLEINTALNHVAAHFPDCAVIEESLEQKLRNAKYFQTESVKRYKTMCPARHVPLREV